MIYEFLLERFLVSFEHSGLCDPKRNRKIPRKNANVAIKRVKSNAPALALSSDSNIDEVKVRKSSFCNQFNFLERGIFRSCLYYFLGDNCRIHFTSQIVILEILLFLLFPIVLIRQQMA